MALSRADDEHRLCGSNQGWVTAPSPRSQVPRSPPGVQVRPKASGGLASPAQLTCSPIAAPVGSSTAAPKPPSPNCCFFILYCCPKLSSGPEPQGANLEEKPWEAAAPSQ